MPGQVKTIINVKHENRDRVTVLFRGILVFPMFIYLGSLMQAWHWGISSVVFTVPSIERNENVAVLFPDVEGGKKLSRWQPIFKVIFAIPLIILGIIYTVLSIILSFLAWIHILVKGKYPDPVIKWVIGCIKYWNRLIGYAGVLVTDEYPTFKLF